MVATATLADSDNSNGADITLTIPTVAAGDILLLAAGALGGGSATYDAVTDFTQIGRVNHATAGAIALQAWHQVCDGTEDGGSVVVGTGSSSGVVAALVLITGCDSDNLPSSTGPVNFETTNNGTNTVESPADTATQNDVLRVSIATGRLTGTSATVTATHESPLSEVADVPRAATNSMNLNVSTEQPGTSALEARTHTFSHAMNESVAMTLAFEITAAAVTDVPGSSPGMNVGLAVGMG